jgi:hypothetical protein
MHHLPVIATIGGRVRTDRRTAGGGAVTGAAGV